MLHSRKCVFRFKECEMTFFRELSGSNREILVSSWFVSIWALKDTVHAGTQEYHNPHKWISVIPITVCAFIAGCTLEIWKKFLLKGEMVFSYRVSQLVCWSNSKMFILNKGFKCFLVVHEWDSCVLRPLVLSWELEAIPVAHHFTIEGRDCLWTGRSSQQLPPLLIERKTVTKSSGCPKPNKSLLKDCQRYDLRSSGAALLWRNLFHWRTVKEIKGWHLKIC